MPKTPQCKGKAKSCFEFEFHVGYSSPNCYLSQSGVIDLKLIGKAKGWTTEVYGEFTVEPLNKSSLEFILDPLDQAKVVKHKYKIQCKVASSGECIRQVRVQRSSTSRPGQVIVLCSFRHRRAPGYDWDEQHRVPITLVIS
jgi:hypothetical protein